MFFIIKNTYETRVFPDINISLRSQFGLSLSLRVCYENN